MRLRSLRINETKPGQHLVEIDGENISGGLQGISVELAPEGVKTILYLKLDVSQINTSTEVELPPDTVALLEKLGWTRPAPMAAPSSGSNEPPTLGRI